jgi:hypothetical protein
MELYAIVERRNGMMSIFVGTQRVHTRIENGRLEPTLPTHEGQQIRAFQRLPATYQRRLIRPPEAEGPRA